LNIIKHASFRSWELVSEVHINVSTNKFFKAKIDRNKVYNKEM